MYLSIRPGSAEDFYPGYGRFRTDTFRIGVRLGSEALTLEAGTLPPILEQMLLMSGTRGLIGTELLKGYQLLYAPRRRCLVLRSLNT